MARRPRIEYGGAAYHMMNRGDHGEQVYVDKVDYEVFLAGLGECCRRCGWVVHAYCLMRNHFHVEVETPEPNLVDGMKWFMGAYTQKFNGRHGLRGHLFQGRYKAQLIEGDGGGYFETVASYIHLNPARAGLLDREAPVLGEYKWSSYVHYLEKKDRPAWLEVRRVFGSMGLKDDSKGREAYGKHMQGRVRELMTKKGRKEYEKVWNPIRYGWCVGSEDFEEESLERLKDAISGGARESYTGIEMARHGEVEAERLVGLGMKRMGLKEEDLDGMKMGAREKAVLAWLVHGRAMVGHRWIADRLKMGVALNTGKYIKQMSESRDPAVLRLRKELGSV